MVETTIKIVTTTPTSTVITYSKCLWLCYNIRHWEKQSKIESQTKNIVYNNFYTPSPLQTNVSSISTPLWIKVATNLVNSPSNSISSIILLSLPVATIN